MPADQAEPLSLLAREIATLRRISYQDLCDRMPRVLRRTRWLGIEWQTGSPDGRDHETRDVVGPSGTVYQLETSIFWDAEEGGNIRVVVAVDGGPLSPTRPGSDDFIRAPDGGFMGE